MYDRAKIKKIRTAAIIALVAILGITAAYLIYDSTKSASVYIMAAPLSADITIGGRSYQNATEHRLQPGEYEVSITKDGYFEPVTGTLTLEAGDHEELYIALEPLEGSDWYSLHPEDSYPLDAITSEQLNQRSAAALEQYPLLGSLPVTVEYYKAGGSYVKYVISYSIDEEGAATVFIKDYTGGNYENALSRIRSLGYAPEDYQIEYADLSGEF